MNLVTTPKPTLINFRSVAIEAENLRELSNGFRISVLGELAAALSHELAQPVFAAHNYLFVARTLAEKATSPSAELVGALEGALAQMNRATKIIKRMHAFIANGEPTPEVFDLNDAIHDAAALMKHELLDHEIALKFNLSFALPPIYADNILVQQVVVNLLRNAMEAIAGCDGAARGIEIESALEPPDSVRVSISDTGPGIKSGDVARIFIPFHSTKGEGSGLGLPLSRAIVEASGGSLSAKNRPSGGAVFSFTLPFAVEMSHEG